MPRVNASRQPGAPNGTLRSMRELLLINEGMVDRGIRIAAGVVLIGLAFSGPKTPWGYAGLLPLISGAIGWCPLYLPFRFSTCGKPHRAENHTSA